MQAVKVDKGAAVVAHSDVQREPFPHRVVVVDSGGAWGEGMTEWLRGLGITAIHANTCTAGAKGAEVAATMALLDATAMTEAELVTAIGSLRDTRDTDVLIALLVEPDHVARCERLMSSGAVDGAISVEIAPSRLVRLLGNPDPRPVLARYAAQVQLTPSAGVEDASLRRLTRREREVLSEITAGASTAAIARHLSISVNTVRTHVQNMLGKLDARSRLELAAIGRKAGKVAMEQVA